MAAQQERKLPFGKIEPNSAKYFWSCALGGIVGEFVPFPPEYQQLSRIIDKKEED